MKLPFGILDLSNHKLPYRFTLKLSWSEFSIWAILLNPIGCSDNETIKSYTTQGKSAAGLNILT